MTKKLLEGAWISLAVNEAPRVLLVGFAKLEPFQADRDELCTLSELKNALRSGDIWVHGSRQFKDFEDYLMPPGQFASLKQASDCDQYLHDRLTLLETQLG